LCPRYYPAVRGWRSDDVDASLHRRREILLPKTSKKGKSFMKRKLLTSFFVASILPSGVVFAQDVPGSSNDLTWLPLVSTLIYGLIGIILAVAGYFVFDRLLGLDLKRELVEDQNTALGIMLAGVFIGIAIVVAAVMIS
jgi:hypothetical protein